MYKTLKQLTEKDHVAFRMLAACGNASTAALLATGISISRIQCYKKEGLIAQITYQNTRSQKSLKVAWGLTGKGRFFVEKTYRTGASSSVNAIRHNVAVAEAYAQILQTNDVDPYHIYSEYEIRPIVEECIYKTQEEFEPMEKVLREAMYISNELSMPDLTYITASGEIVCVEVETKSYSQEKLKAKRKTAEVLEATYVPVRI